MCRYKVLDSIDYVPPTLFHLIRNRWRARIPRHHASKHWTIGGATHYAIQRIQLRDYQVEAGLVVVENETFILVILYLSFGVQHAKHNCLQSCKVLWTSPSVADLHYACTQLLFFKILSFPFSPLLVLSWIRITTATYLYRPPSTFRDDRVAATADYYCFV